MPINFANVNISLRQFQEISSGKYNAGEMRLTSDHSLGKINNSVGSPDKNDTSLSHAEVLAIKYAFVKALRQNGVAAEEIGRVRRELGLEPDGATDTSLALRSVRPLSRQTVREILDRNAETLNGHAGAGTIRSHAELYARYSEEVRAGFAQTRRETNAMMMRARKLIPDRRIVDVQCVIAGNVAFATEEQRARLIDVAERQKAFIMESSNGNPPDGPDATLLYPIPENGLQLSLPLGTSQAGYVKKLDDMLVFLRGSRHPSAETLAVRSGYRKATAAGPEAVSAWFAGLANDQRAAFKARTIAIGLLLDGGVDDWETLSLVNRVSDAAALALATHLANHQGEGLRGDALRQSPAVAALAGQIAQQPVPEDSQAYVPVLSPQEANANMRAVLKGNGVGCFDTRETDMIQAGVRAALTARFGANVYRANATFQSIAQPSTVERAFTALGYPGAARLTAEQIQAAIIGQAESDTARMFLSKTLEPMVQAAGAPAFDAVSLATQLFRRHPQFKARLSAAQSPEQARSIVDSYRPEIEGGIRRMLTVKRCREQAKVWYRERLAGELGVPVSALEGRGVINIQRFSTKSGLLGADIEAGLNNAATDGQIELAFRGLANVSADVRINLMRQTDRLEIPGDARDILKNQILTLDKVAGFDMQALKLRADDIQVDGLVYALSSGASRDKVLEAMGAIGQTVMAQAVAVYNGKQVGSDEIGAAANLLVTLTLAKRPGLIDMVREFFAQPENAEMNFLHLEGVAARSATFQIFKPDIPAAESNAEIADAIGRPGLPSFHAQAVNLALADLGLGGLPPDGKARLLSGPAGQELARMVRGAHLAVTPSQLRALARTAFADAAASAQIESLFVGLSKAEGREISAGAARLAKDVFASRHPGLFQKVKTAVSLAGTFGENPMTAAEMVLTVRYDEVSAVLGMFHEIEAADAAALDTAVRGIAARAGLEERFVREHLDAGALLAGSGGSLAALRDSLRDRLSNPATEISAGDVADVRNQAAAAVEAFVAAKAAFIAEVDRMPVSEAARGSFIADALSGRDRTDPELPAAAGRIMQRPEMAVAVNFAKSTLEAGKVAAYTDEELLVMFENIGARIDAAIDAELSAEKRAAMDEAARALLRSLIYASFVDCCGPALAGGAERLAAAGRFETLDAAAAGRPGPAAACGRELIAAVKAAHYDEWLPAALAEAIRAKTATDGQKALADAIAKRVPDALARAAEGLDQAKTARLKAFAITLDWRDGALAATEAVLRDAAKALREAGDGAEGAAKAEEKLAGPLFKAQDAAAYVASAAQAAGVALTPAQAARAEALLAGHAAGMPAKNAHCLARFIVNLKLDDESAESDLGRVRLMAADIAAWREFTLDDDGKQEIRTFLKDEANELILDYEKPAKKAAEYAGDISKSMAVDVKRGYYTINGKRFSKRPEAEVVAELGKTVTDPKAKRALTILMSQASAIPVLSIQMRLLSPPNDRRHEVLDTAALPGSGEFVSRAEADPELFFARQFLDEITSIYDLSVSEDGSSATLKIVKCGKMVVGTADYNMKTYFGSVVVEEEVTLDLAAEVPTVTNVRVAQRFDDTIDLLDRYLVETEPIPAPPPVPPPPVPGAQPVQG